MALPAQRVPWVTEFDTRQVDDSFRNPFGAIKFYLLSTMVSLKAHFVLTGQTKATNTIKLNG